MYLQIKLPESDTDVHRFLWRDMNTETDPKVYRLLRVTFGDKPSPDMASFVILRIADEFQSEFPDASRILRDDRYVDDIIHSCATKEDAVKKMSELDVMLASGSFRMGWDDPLPNEICNYWKNLFQSILGLREVSFPRSLKPTDVCGSSELHVFCDASGSAYGAVAYLLWPTKHGPEVRLVAAKARVAPLHQTTIPRLELMGALVASRLAKTIVVEFKDKPGTVFLWTDSQIVLRWLQSESIKLKAFVGVRVSEIQSTWEPNNWRYVPSQWNPADDLSRGLPTNEIQGRWMTGPSFLREDKHNWPTFPKVDTSVDMEDMELKPSRPISAIACSESVIKSTDYSSWNKLVRITAYCLRFINNAKPSSVEHNMCALQPEELIKAENLWIKSAQSDMMDWEKRFQDLSPFMADDIIRVGGRLGRSMLEYDQVHPILLPAHHHISKLIMIETHAKVGHAGPERTLSESRRRVWVVRGRNLAKAIVRNCVRCRKLRHLPHSTLMADLPPERLKSFEPPYTVTGVDLFGPFQLKYGRNKSTKAWGALFTCATVRAVHLEIVDGLSTEAFLHALRRFVAHHGWPTTIISDNGTSFIGAHKELKKLVEEGRKQLEDFASLHKVKWKFITPLSPHQGAVLQRGCKSTPGCKYGEC